MIQIDSVWKIHEIIMVHVTNTTQLVSLPGHTSTRSDRVLQKEVTSLRPGIFRAFQFGFFLLHVVLREGPISVASFRFPFGVLFVFGLQ